MLNQVQHNLFILNHLLVNSTFTHCGNCPSDWLRVYSDWEHYVYETGIHIVKYGVNSLKVVGVVANPRKGMNTDTLVTKVLEGAQSIGSAVEKIYLNDLEIKPCQACGESPAPEFCLYKDGMEKIYRALETAGIMVVRTPAYYDSISAQLKLVIDRSNCNVHKPLL